MAARILMEKRIPTLSTGEDSIPVNEDGTKGSRFEYRDQKTSQQSHALSPLFVRAPRIAEIAAEFNHIDVLQPHGCAFSNDAADK